MKPTVLIKWINQTQEVNSKVIPNFKCIYTSYMHIKQRKH